MATKKTKKKKAEELEVVEFDVNTKAELKDFLLDVREKLAEGSAAPIYALTAMNRIMVLPHIYEILGKEHKEIARDIWLRLKQAGFQIKDPPILFGDEAAAVV